MKKRLRQWILGLLLLFAVMDVWAFRIPRPSTYSLPWTQSQINKLNDDLENIWNLQNGEFNMDVVESTKSQADNGDFWLIVTGSTTHIQFKANDHVYTITPDGF